MSTETTLRYIGATGILEEIATERARQISGEGWTPSHDDEHDSGELADAAACYCIARPKHPLADNDEICNRLWPWGISDWKPKSYRRDLIRAAALIVAEIERIDRANDSR